MVQSESRVHHPQVRAPGATEWQDISWDEAIDRIARHLKDDRDENLIQKNDDGVTVNRWNSTGFLISSAASNETGYLAVKVAREIGRASCRERGDSSSVAGWCERVAAGDGQR